MKLIFHTGSLLIHFNTCTKLQMVNAHFTICLKHYKIFKVAMKSYLPHKYDQDINPRTQSFVDVIRKCSHFHLLFSLFFSLCLSSSSCLFVYIPLHVFYPFTVHVYMYVSHFYMFSHCVTITYLSILTLYSDVEKVKSGYGENVGIFLQFLGQIIAGELVS